MGYLNPLLRLPAGRALLELPPADRERIEAVIRDLREQANTEAENAWRRRKGPMRPIGEPSQPMRDTLRTQFPGLRRMNANASTTISPARRSGDPPAGTVRSHGRR